MIGRIRVGAVVSLMVALLVVVGCGGGGAPESSTPPGTLYVALEAEPPELDPNLSSAYVDRQVMASLYDKLVDIDQDGEIVPMLAKSYDVSDDGTVYTFELREGIKFHDGTEFNAEAVKVNLDRYQEEDSVRSTEVEPIESVEVVDPMTVRVTLSEPFAPFLAVLTDRAGIMASPKAIKVSGGRISKDPVGTGPFEFVERVRGDHITVKKNPDYWREGLPKLDKIIYRGIEDENVQYQNLQSGELDLIDSIPLVEFKGLQESGDYRVSIEPGLGYNGIWLNVTRPPFDNEQLRQAVYRLVDREAVAKAALRNVGGTPANSPFSKQSWAYGAERRVSTAQRRGGQAAAERSGRAERVLVHFQGRPLPTQPADRTDYPEQPQACWHQGRARAGRVRDASRAKRQRELRGHAPRLERPDRPGPQHLRLHGDGRGFQRFRATATRRWIGCLARRAPPATKTGARSSTIRYMEILHEEVPYVYLFHSNLTTDFAMQPTVQGFEPYPDGILRLAGVSKQQRE